MAERHTVITDGGWSVSFLVAGDGPGLVMLPGVWQTAAEWQGLGYIDRFASTHRVVAIDFLGHGESDAPTDAADYAAEVTIGRIVAVMEAAGLPSACLWGYATGAEMAVLLARRRPDLIDGVIAGGIYLDDLDKGLRAMGIETKGIVDRAAAALDHGDWEAYFDILPVQVDLERRELCKTTFDTTVMAAITRADLKRPRGFLKPQAPTFAYWGEGEIYADDNNRFAQKLPIDWAVVPGKHSDAFSNVGAICGAVEGFLRSLVRA